MSYRIDGGPVTTGRWSTPTIYETATIPSSFLAAIRDTQTVTLQATGSDPITLSLGGPSGEPLPEEAQRRLDGVLHRRALRSLGSSGLEEPTLFEFLSQLVALASSYRTEERIAPAEDAEEYIWDTQWLAYHAFGHSGAAFLEAARDHAGPVLVTDLQRLDPVETAATGTRQNLTAVLGEDPAAGVLSDPALSDSTADEIVQFCRGPRPPGSSLQPPALLLHRGRAAA